MLYLACYDLEDNKVRIKVANCLLAYGLERLQKSVFVGCLDSRLKAKLLLEIEHVLIDVDPTKTRFMLMPLAEAYTRNTHWQGTDPPDWSYHLNQQLTLFF